MSNQQRMWSRHPMLISSIATALLFVLSGPSANAGADPTHSPVIHPPTRPTTGQPAIYEGVAGALSIKGTQHSLFVEVERVIEPSKMVTRYSVERRGKCYSERSLFLCPILWTVQGRLQPDRFVLDMALERATVELRVKGSPMSLAWDASGDMRVTPGSGSGYVLLQQRDAVGAGTWKQSALKSPPHNGQGLMYRRLE